jgi:hypothetical protein
MNTSSAIEPQRCCQEVDRFRNPDHGRTGCGANDDRRIDVEPSCLACHGTKASRPAFVKENYPADRAFDFKAGDLRGMYAVFIPELRASGA